MSGVRMGKIKTAYNLLKYDREMIPYAIFNSLAKLQLLNWIPDSIYIKVLYRLVLDKRLDLNNPITFTEKLQWLKLHYRRNDHVELVDKYKVRTYIKNLIGEEYLIPLLGVWESVDEIDFNDLPSRFVIKCNHDSGSVIKCKGKNERNIKYIKKKLGKALNKSAYWRFREWPYKYVKPLIIAEKYMVDDGGEDLIDYKFYCFNGNPKYCQVISNRSTNEAIDFYDDEWCHQEFTGLHMGKVKYISNQTNIVKPKNYNKMIELAKILSAGKPFVRVDFYEIKGKVYFGEMTFYPAGGFGFFHPKSVDQMLGKLINIEEIL